MDKMHGLQDHIIKPTAVFYTTLSQALYMLRKWCRGTTTGG
jgi:hypothetical protein